MAQRAEHIATGVPTGIMDQLCIASAKQQHAMLIDCNTLEIEHIRLPENSQVLVRFIAHRTLVGSQYADRVKQCAEAELIIGPLRLADLSAVDSISDSVIQKRARHVITENQRVRDFALALKSNDLITAGLLMNQSHSSLADNYSTSTPQMNEAVSDLQQTTGVFGARMTGGGFGGCVVALCSQDAQIEGWKVSAAGAAHLA
jgi:galactokinase